MRLNDGAAVAAAATTGDDERRTEKGAMRLDRLHASSSSSGEVLAFFCLQGWVEAQEPAEVSGRRLADVAVWSGKTTLSSAALEPELSTCIVGPALKTIR
jgi:hypothetical protein